jgi:hypothetical protein
MANYLPLSKSSDPPPLPVLVLATALGAASIYALSSSLLSSRKHGKLPPGPPSGRLGEGRFDMPKEPYRRFDELAKEYGMSFYTESQLVLCCRLTNMEGSLFSFNIGNKPVVGEFYLIPRTR